jgi:hypothetical protein
MKMDIRQWYKDGIEHLLFSLLKHIQDGYGESCHYMILSNTNRKKYTYSGVKLK